jgi:hypothetical protein
MDEHRTKSRHDVVKAGTIEFDGGIVTCVIRDLSDGGAGLDVVSSAGIPDHFTLVLRTDCLHFPCHVAWREDSRLGVIFD